MNSISPEQRKLLLAVYQLERQEEQASNTAHAALLAAALTLLGAIGVVLLQKHAPGWIYATLPVAPLPLIALVAALVRRGGSRGAYIDACEVRLEEDIDGLKVPSQHRDAHREWRSGVGAFNNAVVLGALAALYVGVLIQSYRAATRANEHTLGLAVLCVCSCLLLGFLLQLMPGLRYRSTTRRASTVAKTSAAE
jgi:hypothetical protein